jgi:hypothetical protein
MQRIMGAATLPKAIRAVRKVLLIDRFQQHRHRSLDNLVLKRGLADRASASIVLLDPYTLDGRGLVHPAAQALVQVPQVLFEVFGIHLCRDPVNPRGA